MGEKEKRRTKEDEGTEEKWASIKKILGGYTVDEMMYTREEVLRLQKELDQTKTEFNRLVDSAFVANAEYDKDRRALRAENELLREALESNKTTEEEFPLRRDEGVSLEQRAAYRERLKGLPPYASVTLTAYFLEWFLDCADRHDLQTRLLALGRGELEEARAAAERLREALVFYADRRGYALGEVAMLSPHHVMVDQGSRARVALLATEKEEAP